MTNKSGTLYVGMTNEIERRVHEHRIGTSEGFTKRYKLNRLIYYEDYSDPASAIEREKQIKGWLRKKKIELVREFNPRWDDFAATWSSEGPDSSLRSE